MYCFEVINKLSYKLHINLFSVDNSVKFMKFETILSFHTKVTAVSVISKIKLPPLYTKELKVYNWKIICLQKFRGGQNKSPSLIMIIFLI